MSHASLQIVGFCAALLLASIAEARDYFTESFSGDFDLNNSTFTFKPDGSSNHYAVCRLPATEFPTSTNSSYQFRLLYGTTLTEMLNLNGHVIPFFGEPQSEVWVNANGSVTFGTFDDQYDSSLSNHFRLPRVSAWLGTLGNQFIHPVYMNSLSNRIALSWINLPEGMNGGSNSVQLELFFDGVIRLTYLHMDAVNGVVGLSPGGGMPGDFSESDLSNVGCSGKALYRLDWSSQPTTVQVGQTFPITLSGRDAFNLDFPVNGPARLLAGSPGVVFQTDFESGAAGFTSVSNSPTYSNAWHITTFRGTQTGHSISHSMYSGFADSATPEGRAQSANGTLISPLIDLRDVYPPISVSFAQLAKDNYYGRVEAQIEGKTNVWVAGLSDVDFSRDTADRWQPVTLDLSTFAGKQIRVRFNASVPYATLDWFIDDFVIRGVTNTIPISPTATSAFTGNSWSGNISLGAPGTNVLLVAVHSNGVFGVSVPLEVSAPNDLSIITVAPSSNLQFGATGSVNVVVSNTGPNGANGVVVTNQIPPGAQLGNAAVSQGSFSVSGNQLLFNFGTIGGGGYALASFEFTATTAATLSFTSIVAQSAGETFLQNNRSVAAVNFGNPFVKIFDTVVREDGTNATFTLQLDAPSSVPVSVNFSTLSATATAGEDFVATNGFVTFPPFTTQALVRVAIIDDALFENRPSDTYDIPEYFWLQLTSTTNAAIAGLSAKCSIQDNDPVPTLSVIITNLPEGNAGTNLVPVIVRMSAPAGRMVDVNYHTETGQGFYYQLGGDVLLGTATRDVDFVSITNSFNFAPGETQRVVYAQIIGDTVAEPDETFTLVFGSNVLMPLVSVFGHNFLFAQITIVDDDPPVLSVDDYQVVVENCGTNNGALDPGETVTVLLRVRNVGYNACTSSNLVATLLPSGGVLNPSGPQNYGAMCGGTPEVWRPFTFTVGAACGSNVTAMLSFTDDGTNRGTSTVNIPVGQRGRLLNENFNSVAIPNLPPGWNASTYSDSPWFTTNEPPITTNQFAHVNFQHQFGGAVTLVSPPFTITSSNAWLKLRHRFEIDPVNAFANLSFRTEGNFSSPSAQFFGSSRGWMISNVPLPPGSIGSTQSIYLELVHFETPSLATWDIDSVDIFDGPASCCDASFPVITSARRTNNNIVLQWTSISNRSYQLQFKPSLNSTQQWADSGAPILANGPLTSKTNTIAGSNGFYRIKLNL